MAELISFRLEGLAEMLKNLDAVGQQANNGTEAALYQEASNILADSQEHYVPVDDNPLKDSGLVEKVKINGSEMSVTMGFGGPAAPYALAVHEHLSAHSPYSWRKAEEEGRPVQFHPPGRGPKYLEIPFNNAQHGMLFRIGDRVRAFIAKAGR